MSEELNAPETPKPQGKPPMSWEDRVKTMSWKNLEGECRRISRKPETKLSGALADALLIVLFKTHDKGNDPYMLEESEQSYYDIWKSLKAATATPGGK